MPTVKSQFDASAHAVQALKERPDSETLLQLYADYKQATVGEVSGKRPCLIDFAGRAKYDAWAAITGPREYAARQAYIALMERPRRSQS